jgi:biotin carboxyl carrier protein
MASWPSPQPSTPPPSLVPAPTRPPRSKGPVFFFVIILIAGSMWYLRPQQQEPAAKVVTPTVKAVRGTIAATHRVAGSITAGRFANITVPRMQAPESGRAMTLTYLADSGSMVKEGALLAEIDAQDARDHLDDVEAMVVQANLDLEKRKTIQLAQMEALRQRVRVARADMLKAREDVKALEVKSGITQELLKLSVEETQAAYDETAAEIPLMEERMAADMNVAKLSYQQVVRHRDRHRHDIERSRIFSPIAGMVVLHTTTRNGEMTQIRLGDRVTPGQPIIRVVDPQSMELSALMSQTEAEMVRNGQRATVRFDAFPDIVLRGKVLALGSMAVSGRRQNYYIRRIPVRVAIENADARVIPDLSASADVETSETAEGLIVPRQCVTDASGKPVVYVRQEAGFAAREVEIGGESNTQVAVTGGLREGEEVATAPHAIVIQ